MNINVDEDELRLRRASPTATATTTVASFTGAQIAGLVASGADEPVTVSLNAAIDNVATGLFSQNVSIVFDAISPTQVNGVAGARTVFTLVQTAGRPFWHARLSPSRCWIRLTIRRWRPEGVTRRRSP